MSFPRREIGFVHVFGPLKARPNSAILPRVHILVGLRLIFDAETNSC